MGERFREEVGDVGMAPVTANGFAKTTPKELGRNTRKEDVVRVLHCIAEGAHPIPRTITFEHLHPRRYLTPNPLPQEYPDLERQFDGPNS
ncbi:Serine/threonine-protein phosphatase PP1 [Hordeum vulgare]|nr:Serine/threonine-protein phosphatase PP1 [Hordeum vulgare]